MSFPRQRRVAPNNDDGIQQDNQTFSSPLQGHAPLPSIHNYNTPFLVVDGYDLPLETNDPQRTMPSLSQRIGNAPTLRRFFDSQVYQQATNSSTGIAQHSGTYPHPGQFTSEELDRELSFEYDLGYPSGLDFDFALNNAAESHNGWNFSKQHATPQTISPALLDARYSHVGSKGTPHGMNRPTMGMEAWSATPTFTNPALPITAGKSKRRKVVSPETGSMQTSVANFTEPQQGPSYSMKPTSTASHSYNKTQHAPSHNQGWMPTAEIDFTGTQQGPVRRKSRMQNTGPNLTANQQKSSSSMYPAVSTPSPSQGQVSGYGNPAASVPPQIHYQQPAGNHNTHHNAWSGGQYGVGHSSASIPPAQPTSHALTAFNQHDNVLSPSTSQEQDFSYFGPASSPPFNNQQPDEYDIFHQDVWSSAPSGQYGAELPTSSNPTAQWTTPGFLQNNQQGNNYSSGPQINIYQQDNVLSSGAQVNQPSNVLSSGPQVNQLNNSLSRGPQVNQLSNSLSSGPQVNQQGVGISSASMPPAQSAPFVPPQVNQQGNVVSSAPQVNQQNVGIPPANGPPAQPAPSVPSQANQKGNVPTSGPQATQQNNVAANGQQINLQREVADYNSGITRLTGHNADMKSVHAIPPNAALPAMELSLTELFTYFPLHTTWPYVMLRFVAAGAATKRISQSQWLVRGVIDDEATATNDNKIRQQKCKTGEILFGVGRTIYTSQDAENQLKTLSAGRVSYDVSAYRARRYYQSKVGHMKLVDIARGVRRHPSGVGAGKFTQVVQHVLANLTTLADNTTVDAVTLANDPQLAFSYPAEQATDDWDEKCLEDMMQELANAGVR
ncbi:hypothetical protein KC343_g4297 [Hortaea werneckii]|nr:hypothetical protein KC352_g10447 [Hortaea werneckii]KAI7564632.1 hypothetical protein KC317_g6928 [Hortaea werneckii]KAI7620139.1 hypothetical protein KC346_g4273 [Hortaea werneckii]KAI7631000.1 hypothetical protein KC343_g4297 [Hortaea werneckii]KAI7678217.1 hypothetical protein KC319_g3475 [Hortaea werneckii]